MTLYLVWIRPKLRAFSECVLLLFWTKTYGNLPKICLLSHFQFPHYNFNIMGIFIYVYKYKYIYAYTCICINSHNFSCMFISNSIYMCVLFQFFVSIYFFYYYYFIFFFERNVYQTMQRGALTKDIQRRIFLGLGNFLQQMFFFFNLKDFKY